mgnify:FL=1
MTSQGHVTRASLKKANREYTEGHFLSACISKGSVHPSLKLYKVNCRTLHSVMGKFDHDQTNEFETKALVQTIAGLTLIYLISTTLIRQREVIN